MAFANFFGASPQAPMPANPNQVQVIPPGGMIPQTSAPQQPGIFGNIANAFANPNPEYLRMAQTLGMLGSAIGGDTAQGRVGGAVANLSERQQLANYLGSQLTPAGVQGPTTETLQRNADGTYTRTEKGNLQAAPGMQSPTAQVGSAFGATPQSFSRPVQAPVPNLGGLPVAVQLRLAEDARQRAAQEQAGILAQQEQMMNQQRLALQAAQAAQDPIVRVLPDEQGRQIGITRSGQTMDLGIGTSSYSIRTFPIGPQGEQLTAVIDQQGNIVRELARGSKPIKETGVITPQQQAQAELQLGREIRQATVGKNKEGKIIPKAVTSTDVKRFNNFAERNNLNYRFTRLKIPSTGWFSGDKRYMFRTDAEGSITDRELFNQLVTDYEMDADDAREALIKLRNEGIKP